jgi:hypothetical protein
MIQTGTELGLAHLLCVDTTELGLDFWDSTEQDRDRTIIPSGRNFFIFNSKSSASCGFTTAMITPEHPEAIILIFVATRCKPAIPELISKAGPVKKLDKPAYRGWLA